jgi:NTE family protein
MSRKPAPPLLAALLLIALLPHAAAAQDLHAVDPAGIHAPPLAAESASRPVVGVALEGGGAMGLAHIGVLQWMEEHHIPIDRLAGTSMGALVGALYSSGVTLGELRTLATSNDFASVFTIEPPYSDLSYRRRQDRHQIPNSITVGLSHGVMFRNALLLDRGVNEFLVSNLSSMNAQDLDFDRLPIPFRCVATDLTSLQPVVFNRGPLPQAVRASISIPGVFSPVVGSNGHYLVDGGILDNLPADVARNDLHAQVVIAVHLESGAITPADTSSIVGVLNRAFSAGIEHNVAQSKKQADLVVTVPLGKFTTTDYNKGGEIIRAGYLAAEADRDALMKYAVEDREWNAYIAARQSRIVPAPGLLRQVKIVGGSASAAASVVADLKPLDGSKITAAATLNALKPIQSNGGYDASYETFTAAATAGSAALRTPGAGPDNSGILVRLTKDPTGPPYLLLSPQLTATTSNMSRMGLNLRIVDQNFGGFGSELRGVAEVGFRTNLSVEYYRLVTPSGYFVEPRAGIVREPVYIWSNQKRVAERFQQSLTAGLEIGRTFGNTMQISAEWRALDTRWGLKTGSAGGPYLSGTAQSGLLHIDIDRESSGTVSPRGYRLSASAGAFYHAIGSSNAPVAQFSFGRSYSFRKDNILGLGAEAKSYLRTNVAEPFRFTLGGPMHLSASSIDEYRGTDLYLTHAGYMHRIAALPTGLGQGLYGLLGYEAGEVWSPEHRAFLRQNGTFGLVGNTPAGIMTFGVSVGDAGHRKVFFTIGRWF